MTVDDLQSFREDGGYFEIGNKARFTVTGTDRVRYLNGQITRNVEKLLPGIAMPACLLTAKGKLCAPLFIWREADALIVESDSALLDAVAARLERYLIADDVTIAPELVTTTGFHVFGHPVPASSIHISRLGIAGYDVPTPPLGLRLAPAEAVERLRIERGLPRWGSELTENTLVQEAKLEDTCVDFDKGCYVGQEVVSRLRSVGRVNRLLTRFTGTLSPASEAVLPLHVQTPTGEVAGYLTSIAPRFGMAQIAALGYVNRQFEALTQFVVTDSAGNTLGNVEKCTAKFP